MPSETTIYRVCSYLRNFFFGSNPLYSGTISIANGALTQSYGLKANQYFVIYGSDLNEGVHQYPITTLEDETFDGMIRGMSIPKALLDIMDDIETWRAKYNDVNSSNMSPYNSESFGGYSYSKGSGGSADTSKDKAGTWQGVFAAELQPWRKI